VSFDEPAMHGRSSVTRCLTRAKIGDALEGMATPSEENFNDYKKAEKKALELLKEMRAVTPKKVDIELALLVAIFELHKGSLPAATVASIIQGHIKQILPFYSTKDPQGN